MASVTGVGAAVKVADDDDGACVGLSERDQFLRGCRRRSWASFGAFFQDEEGTGQGGGGR